MGDGAPAKGKGRFRKTGWCYPLESLLRAEADSDGDDDGPALGASPPRSPRRAAPSGGERWTSARTRKVGGDRSAPRVDRFVLAPLVKIMRAALARRAYVVTRNSHCADILTFLAAQGARFDDVVVVQKKKSKATEIAPRLEPGERGLFVDDDVRECCDPKVAAVPGLTRVLYARGS